MDEEIILNGIDGTTGRYLVPPMSTSQAAALAGGNPVEPSLSGWLRAMVQVFKRPKLGLPMDVEPTNLARAGWAIVFPASASAELRSALEPLIRHRKSMIPPDRCKTLEYRPGESMKKWLARHAAAPGTVSPTKVPYYVTLVGSPLEIPFDFQYLLDIEYAVGRVGFDSIEQYRHYAEGVAKYETAATITNSKQVVYWGTRHPADRATQMSADSLIRPLVEGAPATNDSEAVQPIATQCGYAAQCFSGAAATKEKLRELLHPSRPGSPPAVLFTASHGMGWPKTDERQRRAQGALLCQDWAGFGQVNSDHYFTADELSDTADVSGLIAFIFACYGAGTPQTDRFLTDRKTGPIDIAPEPFLAALPQRMLSHPAGPALAVIGHVERAWGYSIRPTGAGTQIGHFRDFLARVLSGQPVGHAMKNFSERYAALSSELLTYLDETDSSSRPSAQEIAMAWIERNDAQNYVVLGDPAVRIRVEQLN